MIEHRPWNDSVYVYYEDYIGINVFYKLMGK